MYNILIVDDEPIIRRGIKSFVDFKSLKIDEVFEAANGEVALRLFEKQTIHIVLADINMPNMNGLELAAKIKETKPLTKIALITGYDYFDYAVTALKTGVDDYVLKPVSRKDIEKLLVTLIDKIEQEHETNALQEVVKNLGLSGDEENSGAEKDSVQTTMAQLLEANLANPNFSLQYMADELGFSSSYLSGLFKKSFGTPFSDYILDKRMEQAKLLLLSTSYKVYEVAERIGIEDPNYFSAAFKKHVGLSPNQYRNDVKRRT